MEATRQISPEARLRQAEQASAAFKQFRKMAVDVSETAGRFIAHGLATDTGIPWNPSRAGALVDRLMPMHQRQWLGVGAHALVSQLLPPDQVDEVRRWFGHAVRHPETGEPLQWVDCPGRRVVAGSTGVGKTVLAGAFLMETGRRALEARGRARLGSGGAIYTAGSVALLDDMWRLLEALGCDMTMVAAYYKPDQHQAQFKLIRTPKAEVPEVFGKSPIVLVTQQWIHALSAREANGEEQDYGLEQLLSYGAGRRAGVWDEAFSRHKTDTRFDMPSLGLACDAAKRFRLADHNDEGVRHGVAVLKRENERLEAACSEATAHDRGEVMLPPTLSDVDKEGLGKLCSELRLQKQGDCTAVIQQLQKMADNPQTMWVVPSRNKKVQEILCQPRLVVDPAVDRLVILDASHVVSLVRQADPTVEMAEGMRDAEEWLQPKLFGDVVLHIGHGPGGRIRLEKNASRREQLIARQVSRMKAEVPKDAPILVIVFKKKDGGIDWRELVEREMRSQRLLGWQKRVEFTTWGMHVGRNCWRHIGHIFCIGVLQRDYDSDLRIAINAAAETMEEVDPLPVKRIRDAVAGEMCAAVQQLAGRGHCRLTKTQRRPDGSLDPKGHSGEMHLWVELSEPMSKGAVDLRPGHSVIADRLREGMPGVQIVPIEAQKQTRVDVLAEAGMAWLQGQQQASATAVRHQIRTIAAELDMDCAERTLGLVVAAMKLEGLKQGWQIKGRSWLRGAEVPSGMEPAVFTLQDQIASEVLRCFKEDGCHRVKFGQVKGVLECPSQERWSKARRAASVRLSREHGIAEDGRSWVVAAGGAAQ